MWDNKTLELFEGITRNEKFKKEVQDIRLEFGIPLSGFNVEEMCNEEGLFWAEAHIDNREGRFDQRIAKLIKNLNLMPTLSGIISEYVLKGVDYDKSFIAVTGWQYGCHWYEDGDGAVIKVYPGTVKEDIKKYISRVGEDIITTLKLNFPDAYVEKIKKKPMRKRDDAIMSLYEQKIIKYDGNFNEENARKFLISQGIENPNINISEFSEIGYDLPQVAARKKVIQKRLKEQNK